MLVSQKWSPCNSVLMLQLVCILLVCMLQVQAQYTCEVGQETNIKNNKWQWVLPYEDPCTCSKIRFGGMNTITPKRPFEPVYVDKPLVGNNIGEIRDHYKLNCIELTCPRSGSIKQATEPGQATGIVTWKATATGNYGEYLGVDCEPSSGSRIAIGKANIACQTRDEKGNQQSCSFKVEVIDNEAPILESCPSNISQNTDAGHPTAMVTWLKPQALDNSGQVTISCNYDLGSNFTIGNTTVDCNAVDESGNEQECHFTVTVLDNEAPIFESCPSNISQATDAGHPAAMVTWLKPQALDNSGQVTISCNYDLGSNFTIGDTRVDCKAVDESGNEQECNFIVTVLDNEAPVFESCPSNISQVTYAGQHTAMVIWSKPQAQDNSGQVTISCNHDSEADFTTGDTVVNCKAIDGSDNENECHFIVSVLETSSFHPRNCYDIQQKQSIAQNGNYIIFIPPPEKPLEVYCDMTIDNGGWLILYMWRRCCMNEKQIKCHQNVHVIIYLQVFQRRSNGSVDFYREWQEYKDGFGFIQGEFWLGNQYLHEITRQRQYELRVDFKAFRENISRYALYDHFKVKQKSESYRLVLGDYIGGNAGDALTYHNGGAFSTEDVDNDEHADVHCAIAYKGAWWYKGCHNSNLNGVYGNTFEDVTLGVSWLYQNGQRYLLEETEMKIRPRDRV